MKVLKKFIEGIVSKRKNDDARNLKRGLLSTAQAAELLGVSRGTIIRWRKQGVITPCSVVTGHPLYKKSELLNFYNENHNRIQGE